MKKRKKYKYTEENDDDDYTFAKKIEEKAELDDLDKIISQAALVDVPEIKTEMKQSLWKSILKLCLVVILCGLVFLGIIFLVLK